MIKFELWLNEEQYDKLEAIKEKMADPTWNKYADETMREFAEDFLAMAISRYYAELKK